MAEWIRVTDSSPALLQAGGSPCYANFYQVFWQFIYNLMSLPFFLKYIAPYFHPVLMWLALGLSFYALYLGMQSRRIRYVEGDVKKELIQGRYGVRHYQAGSLLLALMVLGALGAMAITYLNNGKLFVGSHLLAGLSLTGLVAVSASLAPFLQKGREWARLTHITLGLILLSIFTWQAVTGMQIVQKLISQSTGST